VHDRAAPLTTWQAGAPGPALPSSSSPAGAALSDSSVVAAAVVDATNNVIEVQQFSASGGSVSRLARLAGYLQPTVVSDGARVWLVAVRVSDGALVSRAWSAAEGFAATDRVEVAGDAVGPIAWPNVLRQSDGRLRVLLEGGGSSSTRSSVWSFQRAL
jgi:hypothetical protein